ncbi:hypothetical protein JCM11491_002774 [Sporobolomyces phaffii]
MSANCTSTAQYDNSVSTPTTPSLPLAPDPSPQTVSRASSAPLEQPANWRPAPYSFKKDNLPPLLEIRSPELRDQAVRHKTVPTDGMTPHDAMLFRHARELESYERLETRGDSVLTEVVTDFLFRYDPPMTSGTLSDIRRTLTCNDMLAYLSVAYGLPDRLIYFDRPSLSEEQGIAADLFEAHIGGLFLDSLVGELETKEWLKEVFSLDVWDRLVEAISAIENRKREADQARYARKLGLPVRDPGWKCDSCDAKPKKGRKRTKIVWEPFHQLKGWHAHIYYNGKHKACGHGPTKKEAVDDASANYIIKQDVPESE